MISSESVSDDYLIDWGERLGCGMNGSVRSATKRMTGEKYAVKVIRDRPRARAEVEIHRQVMDHPHVVQLHQVFCNELKFPGESEPSAKLILIMEKMEGGELFQRIAQHHHFTEREAVAATNQIAEAVHHLHVVHNIAHRDLKPENLLYNYSEGSGSIIKLCDFGFAKIDNSDLATPQFTPYYASPQVLEAQKKYKRDKTFTYSKSCDMWSLGVIIYILLCGYPPFYPSQPTRKGIDKTMKKRIASAEFEFPQEEWALVSDNAKDLITGLLTVDPEKRLTISQVLRHPWLVSEAPEIPLQSPHFIKSRDAVATALAAGNRRLKAIELKPIEEALNPILIRTKQRQNSENFSTNKKSTRGIDPVLPSIERLEIDMADPVMILRTALCHLLNMLHMKQDQRATSDDWFSWKELVTQHKILRDFAQLECKSLNNVIALNIKKTIISLDHD